MNDLDSLINQFYQATGISKNMPVGAGAVTIPGHLSAAFNPFRFWDYIEQQISKTDAEEQRTTLMKLRDKFSLELLNDRIGQIKTAFNNSPREGLEQWIKIIAEAISYFRPKFFVKVSTEQFPFPEENRGDVEMIRRGAKLFNDNRWIETYECVKLLLSKEFIPRNIQAMLHVVAGQIELFQLVKPELSQKSFDTAESLSADQGYVMSGKGDYLLYKNDLDGAKKYFQAGMALNPELPINYHRMGEIMERENDLKGAESWYQLHSLHENLLKLYGRIEFFDEKKDAFVHLAARAIEMNPENEYNIYIILGSIYELNKKLPEAHQWYSKAMQLDRTRLEAYVREGYCYGLNNEIDLAESNFRTGIQLAPEASDANLGLAWLFGQKGNFDEAIRMFRQCLIQWPEIGLNIKLNIADSLWKKQDYTGAVDELKTAMSNEADNSVLYTLENYAIEFYKNLGNPTASIEIYDFLLKIIGPSYSADYHNRLGNLRYYLNDFNQAAEEYSKAILITPQHITFHTNLLLALKEQKKWSEATTVLDGIKLLNHDEEYYNKELAIIINAEGNEYFAKGLFREATEKYAASITAYPLFEIVHKNLSLAWENLNEPGRKAEAFTKAISALRNAAKLSGNSDYNAAIELLKRKQDFIKNFGENSLSRVNAVTPLLIELTADLVPYVENSSGGGLTENVSRLVSDMRTDVMERYGIRAPGILFRGSESDFASGNYVILLMEVPVLFGSINTNEKFAPTKDGLREARILSRNGINPLTREEGAWILKEDWQKAEENGILLWDIMEYPIKHIQSLIEANLVDFIGSQEVSSLLGDKDEPGLSDLEAAEKLVAFTNVCKGLVDENVPIKQIKKIRESFESYFASGFTLLEIVEKIRLLPELSTELKGNENHSYKLLRLGSEFEQTIENSLFAEGSNMVLAMEPEICQEALTAIRNKIATADTAIVVEKSIIRPFVRKLIEPEFPATPVLSKQELAINGRSIEDEIEIGHSDLVVPKRTAGEFQPGVSSSGIIAAINNNGQDEKAAVNIKLFVSKDFYETRSLADTQSLNELLELMNTGLFYELGIIIPVVQVNIDVALELMEFRIVIDDKDFKLEGISSNSFLVNDSPDRLKLLNVEGSASISPANGYTYTLVEGIDALKTCRDARLIIWGSSGYIILHLASLIRRNAPLFQDLQTTQFMLDSLEKSFPVLIEIVLKKFNLKNLCAILKELLSEEISIRDFRTILESLLSITGTSNIDTAKYIVFMPQVEGLCFTDHTADVDQLLAIDYANFVRTSLKRYISYKYSKGQTSLIVYLVDNAIEKSLADSTSTPLSEEANRHLIEAFTKQIGSLPASSQKPVILTSYEVRRPLKNLLEKIYPDLPVVNYQELSPELNIQPIGKITLS